jgi:phosphoglycerol geranylgeranyltransferase
MRVKEYLWNKMAEGTMHMTLIDPASQTPERAGKISAKAERLGSDAIMVGGSTGVTNRNLDETLLAIRSDVNVPIICFPSGVNALSPHCDAMYFMSMLNSRNLRNVIGEQVRGAPLVKRMGLETIPMGYLIVEPGMKVGEVGEAEMIGRGDLERAIAFGLAAEFLGMELVYLEAGSGAPDPVPAEMVRAVKHNISIPLVVGGGIRRPEQAALLREAGADIIVTGTVVENGEFGGLLKSIIDAIKL